MLITREVGKSNRVGDKKKTVVLKVSTLKSYIGSKLISERYQETVRTLTGASTLISLAVHTLSQKATVRL